MNTALILTTKNVGQRGGRPAKRYIATTLFTQNAPQGNRRHSRFPGPQAEIRAELIGSDACAALGVTVRATAPVPALCRRLIEEGHDPATPLEAWCGDVLCLRVRSIGAAAALRIGTHGVGFETLSECTAASPMRQNEVASAHSPSRAAP
jgi:hypothetical protein